MRGVVCYPPPDSSHPFFNLRLHSPVLHRSSLESSSSPSRSLPLRRLSASRSPPLRLHLTPPPPDEIRFSSSLHLSFSDLDLKTSLHLQTKSDLDLKTSKGASVCLLLARELNSLSVILPLSLYRPTLPPSPLTRSRSKDRTSCLSLACSFRLAVGDIYLCFFIYFRRSYLAVPKRNKEELERFYDALFYDAFRKHEKDWKKAYSSLYEGTASVVGLIAKMTDHYSNLSLQD